MRAGNEPRLRSWLAGFAAGSDEAGRGGAEAQAERIASGVFIASRLGQLAFSSLMVINDRRHYTRPVLQTVVLSAAWLESGWLFRRIFRAGRYDDPAGLWIDTLTAAGALLVSQRGMGSDAAAPWPKNITIGAALGASAARSNSQAAAIMATLCTAAVGAGVRARGREAHVAGLALAINDAVNWTGMHIASRVYMNAHRRYGRLRDEADALTVERAAASASEAERSRQHEQLHRVTIGVLDRLGASSDLGAAVSVARAEAARLRYALRTGGRIAQGLDQALAELTEESRAAGMGVELVSAELAIAAGPWITQALRTAVRQALLAARELGGAERAVVRAVSDADGVVITIRDHGAGFEPGAGSDYEARLRAVGGGLQSHGGGLELWSEPAGGVRVVLTAPVAASTGVSGDEDTAQGLPDDRVGRQAAGDDDRAVLDRDVDVRFTRSNFDRAQDEVGLGGYRRVDPGRVRDPFESGAQQRLRRGDASRRLSWPWRGRLNGGRHPSSVASSVVAGVGRTTQFDELSSTDTRQADRTLLAAVLAWRVSGLITGAASLIAGRNHFRSRPLAFAQLALGTVESVWFARRVLSSDRWADASAAGIDAAAAAALLAVGQFNLPPAHRHTWINWAPWSFAANAISAQAMGVRSPARGRAGAGAIIATYAAQNVRIGDAVANSAALAGFFGGSRLFAGQIRGGAVRLEDARTEAVAEGQRLAEARERSVQLRVLHDDALQTLETIASGRFTDVESVLARARAESRKLSDELSNRAAKTISLVERLGAMAAEQTAAGLTIEFECHTPPEVLDARADGLAEGMADALYGATHEAITNVRKHAGVDRVRVVVLATSDEVIVTITDQGAGFDPTMVSGGFGMGESISRRMRDAGGRAEIDSAPGAGTRVRLSGPA